MSDTHLTEVRLFLGRPFREFDFPRGNKRQTLARRASRRLGRLGTTLGLGKTAGRSFAGYGPPGEANPIVEGWETGLEQAARVHTAKTSTF